MCGGCVLSAILVLVFSPSLAVFSINLNHANMLSCFVLWAGKDADLELTSCLDQKETNLRL